MSEVFTDEDLKEALQTLMLDGQVEAFWKKGELMYKLTDKGKRLMGKIENAT